jgi:hypothetical protein
MNEIEKKVNTMIGQYTMNEYKAYKNLVKHKKKIKSSVFGDLRREVFSLSSPRPSCENVVHCCGQLFGRTSQSLEDKILEEKSRDPRRDYIFWCSSCEDKVT